MRVYIFTKQLEIGYILAEELHKLGHFTLIFSDFESLFLAIKNNLEQPHLIAADYTIFKYQNYEFSTALEKDDFLTPVIYYNEPCITRGSRSQTWLGTIKEKMALCYNQNKKYDFYNQNLEEYKQLFIVLQLLVESEELSQYIPLMQKPKVLPENIKKTFFERLNENSFDTLIYNFKKRVNLPRNLFNLLQLLNELKNNFTTAEQLSKIYTERYRPISAKSIKVLISNLRHYIEEDTECIFYIADNKYGYKLI